MAKTKVKTRTLKRKKGRNSLLFHGRSFEVPTLLVVAAVLVGIGFVVVKSRAAVTPSCTMTNGASAGKYYIGWTSTNLFGASLSAVLTHSAVGTSNGNTTRNLGTSVSLYGPVNPYAGYLNYYTIVIWNAGKATTVSCSTSIDLRASNPPAQPPPSIPPIVPPAYSPPPSYNQPPSYTPPNDSSPSIPPPAVEESQPPADDAGWVDSGDSSYDPYAGYATTSDDGAYEALLDLGEVSLEDLSGASNQKIQEIIEAKTKELKAKKAAGSSGDVINRAYAGKLKLLPPGQAVSDGPDQVNYYMNAKLKAKVKKSPFSYTLDTTRLKNGRYALTIVPYQNGEKLGEYSYGITIKNKLNFWQQIFNVITNPFS